MSSFGLRAFLRPIAHPPGAIKAGSGRRAFLRLIHPSSQASSSGLEELSLVLPISPSSSSSPLLWWGHHPKTFKYALQGLPCYDI